MITPVLLAVIAAAFLFEFINGFHDTANAIATSVYTRALTAKQAILLAAVMNFIGALVSEKVAMTISTGLVGVPVDQYVILAALLGAIAWNLITWYFGIPSSSSHALIGGLLGAAIVFTVSAESIIWSGVMRKVVIPLFTSPVIGFFIGFGLLKFLFRLLRRARPHLVNKIFARLQIFSAALVAYSHGNNDAQKTMGIITLSLVNGGLLGADHGVPLWVKVTCAIMIALGTSVGGWKIMRTMGNKVTKLQPVSGFAAQTAAAAVIEAATFIGAPVSTTHVITTSIMGCGSARSFRSVKWDVAKNIVIAWFITLPITMIFGGLACWLLGLML